MRELGPSEMSKGHLIFLGRQRDSETIPQSSFYHRTGTGTRLSLGTTRCSESLHYKTQLAARNRLPATCAPRSRAPARARRSQGAPRNSDPKEVPSPASMGMSPSWYLVSLGNSGICFKPGASEKGTNPDRDISHFRLFLLEGSLPSPAPSCIF